MRVVFMGTPEFAVPTLLALGSSRHQVLAVYTRADAASGRGKKLLPSAVKAAALEHLPLDTPIHTPASLRDPLVVAELASYEPDAIVVAAYGLILPKEVLDIPRLGCLNVHGSLLPRWRGAAPIQRGILAGDEEAGACIMRMEEGLDTGCYHRVGAVDARGKNTEELTSEVAALGAQGLIEALDALEVGEYSWIDQDESQVTYAAKIAKDETLLFPELSVEGFLRRLRAASSSAPARCMVCDKAVEALGAHEAADELAPGQVLLEKKRIALGCADGSVELDQVKPQGKKAMEAKAWVAGLRGAQASWAGMQ